MRLLLSTTCQFIHHNKMIIRSRTVSSIYRACSKLRPSPVQPCTILYSSSIPIPSTARLHTFAQTPVRRQQQLSRTQYTPSKSGQLTPGLSLENKLTFRSISFSTSHLQCRHRKDDFHFLLESHNYFPVWYLMRLYGPTVLLCP